MINLNKDEVGIIAVLIGWLAIIFGGGRAWENMAGKVKHEATRIDALEKKPPYMLLAACDERRAGCGRENKLQFDAGERQFAEIKKLIADNDRASNERHTEIMKILMEMNRHG